MTGIPRHGHSSPPSGTFKSWRRMMNRCVWTANYERYRTRNITVCKRWLTFENFLADMGLRPAGKTLGRIDNNGNYTPSNCRWETWTEQSNNRTTNHILEFRGRRMTIAQWSREVGIDQQCLGLRLRRGWSVERTLTVGRQA